MKRSKKTLTVLSFTVGACLFVSTAFADMTLGSGYDRLKGAVKQTAAQMEKGLDSYTVETMYTLKDNGQNLVQSTSVSKFDTVQQVSEDSSVTQYANGESTSSYSYSDPQQTIWKDTDGKYYVSEVPKGIKQEDNRLFRNPFHEEGAAEIEKIVDAVVGNLKDYVQAEERPEGGRAYSGTLSEAQVPALVNAVSSFALKQMISEQGYRAREEMKFPRIESDVYVKKVSGTALENKSGVLEHLTADFVVAGKDKDGAQHDLSLNLVFKLTDINSTTVTVPDLTGANVEKVNHSGYGFSEKYVGTYKNDIVVEKDGEFVKVGERVLEIKSVSDKKVTGSYTEVVKPGFESEHPKPYRFDFEFSPDGSRSNSFFTYSDPEGKQRNGELHPGSYGKVYVTLNVEIIDEHSYRSDAPDNFEGQFNRVFE